MHISTAFGFEYLISFVAERESKDCFSEIDKIDTKK